MHSFMHLPLRTKLMLASLSLVGIGAGLMLMALG
jgi:hypothetical protein